MTEKMGEGQTKIYSSIIVSRKKNTEEIHKDLLE